MADNVISKIELPDGSQYSIKDAGAARSNHTHTTTLAEDSTGTSSISLKAGTKYKLTSGGTPYTFTTPADTNDKVTQTATTTSANYEILFSGTADNTNRTEGARKTSTLTYNPSTKDLSTGGKINGYTLAAASAKSVDETIGANSTSTNLPTSKAVATFVEGKGYVTNSGVTQVGTGAGLTGGTITGTGTIKANLTSETKLTNAAADGTETAGRVYPVRLDKDGKLAVNVPWVDRTYTQFTGNPTSNQTPAFGSTFTIQQISQATTGQVSGIDRTVTIPGTIAANDTKGLIKPWYNHTKASTGPTAGSDATAVAVNTISSTAGRYYAAEIDSNGRLFTNVPWTDTTYTSKAAASNGTDVSLVTTGEKYTWNNKSNLTIGTTSSTAMAGNTNVNNVSIAADIETNASYPLVFGTTSTSAAKVEGLQKNSTKFYVNPSTGNIQATKFNGITLTAAAGKGITDNSSNADVTSTDTNLITGRTLYYQLAKKGYTTNTGTVTTITLKAGSGITLDVDNTPITTSGTRTIGIATSGVTNAMLAGSIDNSKLSNSTISIGGNLVALGGSISLADLGLDSAMHYRGTVAAIPPASGTYVSGDVVVLSGTVKEYVYDGTNWRELGTEGSYKIKQTAYSDSTGTSESTTATRFVYSISQTADGAVSFKTRPLPTYNNYSHPTGDGNKHVPANGTGNDGKFLKATATAGTYEWANAVTSVIPGNGLINGTSGTSQTAITTTGTISIKEGGVTNSMLAGSIANNKLANSSITVGNKSISLGSSGTIDQIMFSSTSIGTNTSWDITNSGFYYVASSGNFTGEQNPGTNQEMPYTYGGLYVMHAGNGGAAQFYISHNASNTKSKANGIRYRSGWNVVNHTRENNTTPWISWATILDDKNYNLFVPTLTGIGASGTWGISITGDASGTASNVTGTVAIANGGTGKTTAGAAANALLSGLPTWTADPTDNTVLIRRDTGGSESYGKVTFSTVWNYIKGKADSTYSTSGHGHGNIANNGTITSTGVALANGDQLLFSDSSNSGKIERSSITIGTATNTWLCNNGTWTTPTAAQVGAVALANGVTAVTWDSTNKKITRTINGTAADVVAFEGTSPITVTGAANKLTIAHNGNSGYKHIPSGGSSGQFLGWDSDGTAKWVANPNSDTKVTLAAITSGTAYYPVVGTGTGNAQRQIDTTGFAYKGTNGTTSAVGAAELTLGNSTASGTANNKQGKLTLYGSTAYTHTLLGAPTSARTITLPDATGTVELTSHIHGNLTHDGKITSTATIANGDKLVIVDSDTTAGSKITGSSITFDGSTTTKALTQKGTWETFNNYSHPTGDGNLHVPATGTTHNGQVLKAGSTAGSISWGTLSASDVGALAVGGNAVSATTATNLSAAPTITATGTATVNLAANTAYTLTVGGKSVVFKTPSDANTNTLVNYTLGETTKAYLMASQNAPTTTTTARAAHGDTGVYLTATAGEFSAVRHSYNVAGIERAYTHYNMTDQSIDFVFV